MWKQLKALRIFAAFRKGCEIYHEMLVAMGLAPEAIHSLPTDQPVFEPPLSSIHIPDIYIMKAARNLPRFVVPVPSTENLRLWN